MNLLRLVRDLLFSIFANSNLPIAEAAALRNSVPSPLTDILWRRRPLTAAHIRSLDWRSIASFIE
jgi:hypothetical protein